MTIANPLTLEEKIKSLGLLDPTDRRPRERRAARRLERLDGARAGFMENHKGNADVILAHVRDRLAERYRFESVVWLPKFIYSAPAEPEVLDALAEQCDFVVTSIGD